MIEAAEPVDVPMTHAYHNLVLISEYTSFGVFFSTLQKGVVRQWKKFRPAAAIAASFSCSKSRGFQWRCKLHHF